MRRAFVSQGELSKSRSTAATRKKVEGADLCTATDDDAPRAAMPPHGSRFYRAAIWNPGHYHQPQKLNHRRYGRCTGMQLSCSWHEGRNATPCFENATHTFSNARLVPKAEAALQI
jgi:hypothetical protein